MVRSVTLVGVGLCGAAVAACSGAALDGPSFESQGSFGPVSQGATDDTADTSSTGASAGPTEGSDGPETSANPTQVDGTSGASDGSSGDVATSTGGGTGSSDGPQPDPLACTVDDLGSVLGVAVAVGSNVMGGDDVAIACASGGGDDVAHVWAAPAAGSYTFDLAGSSYDTALAVLAEDCDGAALGCNDDGPADDGASQLTMELAQGEQVVIVIDGYDGETGNYVLGIREAADISCADGGDLGGQLGAVAMGSTVGATNDFTPGCGGIGGPDVAFAWTATVGGSYTFSLVGSSYDTIISVVGDGCRGAEIACNDDATGLQSEVVAAVAAGETVIVVVDGFNGATGNYVLTID